MTNIQKLYQEYTPEIYQFLSDLISAKGITGAEEQVAQVVKAKMLELGYDQVLVSKLGDIVGVMGTGSKKILFDSHMDTVEVNDEQEWEVPPFAGKIDEEYVHGRGTVDMKSSIACTVYAAYFAKKLGYLEGKTVYVSASVMEEDFDAYAVGELLKEFNLNLDYAVICEPSEEKIALGHRGRAMIKIVTNGVSCHGSAPENGINAVYSMAKIIQRVEDLNQKLYKIEGEHGSVALSKIECETVSLNAVPSSCTIYLDRRLALGETYDIIAKELDELILGIDAKWAVDIGLGTSYTGKEIEMYTFLPAWSQGQQTPLAVALAKAYEEQVGKQPEFFKWNFCTNGVATAQKNISTIGLGPGEIKYCHMKDEKCKLAHIKNCLTTYAALIHYL